MASTDYQSKVNMEIHWSISYSSWENAAIQTISKVLCLVPSATIEEGVANLARVQRKATQKITAVKKRDLRAKSQGAGKINSGEEKVKEITDFWSSATGGTFHRRWPPALHLHYGWTDREARGLNRQRGRISVKYKEFHDMRNSK